jgi:hypothetical protein
MVQNKIILLDKEFHFGIGFLTELLENTGYTLQEIGEKMESGDVSIYPKLMYYSHLYAIQRKKEQPDFDIYDINDLIDENGGIAGTLVVDFTKAFFASLQKGVPVDENKKKVTRSTK